MPVSLRQIDKKPSRRGTCTLYGSRIWLALAICLFAGCATATGGQLLANDPAAESADALDLDLRQPDGTPFQLASWRGKPVLLFLFATYDLGSQAALKPLLDVLKRHASIFALGIALQPDPAKLLKLYGEYWSIPFPLTFDPKGVIVPGQSGLGPIPVIPAYFMLDGRGAVIGRFFGVAQEPELEKLLAIQPPR